MRSYEYQRLRPGSNSIRLLQIQPGAGDEKIACQVFQYTLRNEKASALYEALSYVWGSFDNSRKIHIKNAEESKYRSFRITYNLYAALLQLRDPDLPRTFWIDAICINQDDVSERASQVQIMARIYAYALSVSVWLGEEENGSSYIMEMCRGVVAEGLSYSREWPLTSSRHLERSEDALTLFLSRPWFRRVWVVQEVAVAKNVSVLCGEAEITGAIFTIGLQVALNLLNLPIAPVLRLMDKSNASFQILRKLADLDLSRAVPSFEILPLGQLLGMFQNHEATVRLDKVYALLGLSSDNHISPNMRPNYEKSWSSLFRDVITHVLGPTADSSTWNHREAAIITSMGCPLGTVRTKVSDNEHEIAVMSPKQHTAYGPGTYWTARWAVSAHVHKIRDGDLLCFLEGARDPSLLRLCHDHYDIVLISIPPPPGVRVECHPPTLGLTTQLVPWDDFIQCIPKHQHPRRFNMIWDWNPKKRYADDHSTLFTKSSPQGAGQESTLERVFNTARILDDLGDLPNLDALLAVRKVVTVTPNVFQNHLSLLKNACNNWSEYLLLKQHIAELRWLFWVLSSKNTAKSLDIVDYWASEGIGEYDLEDIMSMLRASAPSSKRSAREDRSDRWSFSETRFAALLAELCRSYIPLESLVRSSKLRLETSIHNGRYVMKVFLRGKEPLETPSYQMLQRLREHAKFELGNNRYQLMLAIISEHATTNFDWMAAYELAITSNPVDWHTLRFLLVEIADRPFALFQFFENLDLDPASVVLHLLQNQMALLTHYIEDLGFCELEMTLWLSKSAVFESNLRALCDVFEFAPLLGRGHAKFTPWGLTVSEHRRERHDTYWRRSLSTIRCDRQYSVEALARFARNCVLDAMDAHLDRLNPNEPPHRLPRHLMVEQRNRLRQRIVKM